MSGADADESQFDVARSVGTRVNSLRLQHGWTLDDLAARAAVSRRTLVSIEQGAADARVATLLRLAAALGVTVGRLVDFADADPIQVRRSGERAVLWRGPSGGSGVIASTTPPPWVVALWEWQLMGGEFHGSGPHALGTRELLLVATGTVHLSVGSMSVELQAGDSAAFNGDEAHEYRNFGTDAAHFSLVVFEPGVQRTAR